MKGSGCRTDKAALAAEPGDGPGGTHLSYFQIGANESTATSGLSCVWRAHFPRSHIVPNPRARPTVINQLG